MLRVRRGNHVRTHKFSIAVSLVIGAVMLSHACLFDTKTTLCERTGLRCPSGWACTLEQDACTQDGCGDGIVRGEEICDDGNKREGDGCSANCTREICGNGTLEQGEACDDSNTKSGDGCSSDCAVETCGNKVLDPQEECDTGTKDSPGCNFPEDDTWALLRCTFVKCGDGYMNEAAGEECDTGGLVTPECNSRCKKPICGDGFYDPDSGEQCDTVVDSEACNGKDNDLSNGDVSCHIPRCGDKYTNGAFVSPQSGIFEICDTGGNSQICDGDCTPPECGDGYWNPEFTPAGATRKEECDNGMANSDTQKDACRTNCRKAFCGDGVTDSGEQCDDGSSNSDTQPNTCRSTCHTPFCGDGVIDSDLMYGEQCDPTSVLPNHGCSIDTDICAPDGSRKCTCT